MSRETRMTTASRSCPFADRERRPLVEQEKYAEVLDMAGLKGVQQLLGNLVGDRGRSCHRFDQGAPHCDADGRRTIDALKKKIRHLGMGRLLKELPLSSLFPALEEVEERAAFVGVLARHRHGGAVEG